MNYITDRQTDDFFGEYERPVSFESKTAYSPFTHKRRINMIKKDCFAYRRSRCRVLTEMVCKYGQCSFFKTAEQDRNDRIKYKLDKNYRERGLGRI